MMKDIMTPVIKNLISISVNCFMVFMFTFVMDLIWAMFLVILMEIHFFRQEFKEFKSKEI